MLKRTLLLAEEGGAQETAQFARFQVAEGGRLCVFFYVNGTSPEGKQISENRVLDLRADGSAGDAVVVPLKRPFVNYFTATVRAGSPRSHVLDLLGQQSGSGNTISYARVRLW